MSLGDYLRRGKFGRAFERDHLLPMAAAIWSAPPDALLDYPAASFIGFFENHGLLKLRDRPQWRSVVGGSRTYVGRIAKELAGSVRLGSAASNVQRNLPGVSVRDAHGCLTHFDHVVIATHADEALAFYLRLKAHSLVGVGSHQAPGAAKSPLAAVRSGVDDPDFTIHQPQDGVDFGEHRWPGVDGRRPRINLYLASAILARDSHNRS